jgi:hypothetical protein
VFSAVLFLRLWRFAKVLYAVQKQRIRDLEDITRLHKPSPSSQGTSYFFPFLHPLPHTFFSSSDSFCSSSSSSSSSSRSKLFDPVTSDETRSRERTLEMEKSVLAAELRLAKEQLEKYKDQISDVLLREGLPATAEQLRRSDGNAGSSETKLNGARRAASLSNLKTVSSSSSASSPSSSLPGLSHSSGNRSLSSSSSSSADSSVSSSASSSPEEKKKKKKRSSSTSSSSSKKSSR